MQIYCALFHNSCNNNSMNYSDFYQHQTLKKNQINQFSQIGVFLHNSSNKGWESIEKPSMQKVIYKLACYTLVWCVYDWIPFAGRRKSKIALGSIINSQLIASAGFPLEDACLIHLSNIST